MASLENQSKKIEKIKWNACISNLDFKNPTTLSDNVPFTYIIRK